MKDLIDVIFVGVTDKPPLALASLAGKTCYNSTLPDLDDIKLLDVENQLFKPSHHTTIEHSYLNFAIDGISVGEITLGLHLVNQFYNSDQRSGRFCAKMFLEPDYPQLENYINTLWPQITAEKLARLITYIKNGLDVFSEYSQAAGDLASIWLKEQRPFLEEKTRETNAKKIAQEQMRAFIPVIFPSGLVFSIDLITLASLWRTAWTPGYNYAVKRMVETLLDKFPEVAFMFSPETASTDSWAPKLTNHLSSIGVVYEPYSELLDISNLEKLVLPDPADLSPVDLLPFLPKYAPNKLGDIHSRVKISLATKGQDQRHRTIDRGPVDFTGEFYLPPLAKELKLEEVALEYLQQWLALKNDLPETLWAVCAPYGAVVTYEKKGSFNAIIHEQAKRLCFCTQEEIYNLNLQLRQEIADKIAAVHPDSLILKIFQPPCYDTGKCVEGARCCGRDRSKRFGDNYFPKRKV